MYSIASTTAQITSSYGDVGTILGIAVVGALTGVVALMGLGFAVRLVKKHITGRKF